jgi:hemolysin activation/secretion protein
MRNSAVINKLTLNVLLLTILSSYQLYAAPVIDFGSIQRDIAGGIQRDIENLNTPNLPPAQQATPAEIVIPKSEASISVKVTAFQFLGATLLEDALLQAEVQPYIGQSLDYDGLNKVTQKISQHRSVNYILQFNYFALQQIICLKSHLILKYVFLKCDLFCLFLFLD